MQITGVTTHRASRRAFTAMSLAAVGAAATASATLAQTPAATPAATPIPGSTAPGDGRFLIAGDRSQRFISIYSIPDLALAATIENVSYGVHGGALQLPDGRLLFVDTGNDAIVTLAVDANGQPVLADSVSGTFGGGVAWVVASPDFRYVAIGSLLEEGSTQVINILDVETFANTEVEIEMVEAEELTAWLLNDPLNIYLAVGGQVNSYLLSELLAGNTEPLNTVQVELESHGGATDAANARIFLTTGVGTGFEVLDVAGGEATYLTQIPWDIDGFSGARNARARVTHDGQHIFGVMAPALEDPTQWTDLVVTNHITDTANLTATRVQIGTGLFGTRWGITDRYALWAGYNADGGTVYLIDADATSDTFGTAIATFPIPAPQTNGAVPGEDSTGTDTYTTAITADSAYGFVAINGDQLVKVYDLATQTEIGEIALDLPFAGFDGFLTILEPGVVPVDLWGR